MRGNTKISVITMLFIVVAIGVPLTATADDLIATNNTATATPLAIDGTFPPWMSGADRELMTKAGHRPTFIVAKDGSGMFYTVNEAVDACPDKHDTWCTIHVKTGLYQEQVKIPNHKGKVFLYGDGSRNTIITYNMSAKLPPMAQVSHSGTVKVEASSFMAKWMGFKNTAGPLGEQAVALHIRGGEAVIFECRIEGYQDTLFVQKGRQFFRNCMIAGTIDFIFGSSATIIQNSLIVVRKGLKGQYNVITADGNENGLNEKIGIVIQNCRIVPDKNLAPERFAVASYLGRPWKKFSTTVIINTEMGDFIRPEGWVTWEGKNHHESCRYIEFNNYGPGANTAKRVSWAKVARSAPEVVGFTAAHWFNSLDFVREAGVPFQPGL